MEGRPGAPAYRIRKGQWILLDIGALKSGGTIGGVFFVDYDDGTSDRIDVAPVSISLGENDALSLPNGKATKDGWVTAGYVISTASAIVGAVYVQAYIMEGSGNVDVNSIRQKICEGYTSEEIDLGQFDRLDYRATYVFQGTVAEDATAGTHVCTATITPGAGNSLEVVAGQITVGATATAQGAFVKVDDGTNTLYHLLNGEESTATVSGLVAHFPTTSESNIGETALAASSFLHAVPNRGFVSGSMRLILTVTTAAVSVTQTFAVVCRVRGLGLPTATLADSVGAPTLTTNTNTVF